ncbi:MAG: HEAT repeat domain-containing protein [Gammaproteobacteria bacterium]|nr:HEAT repeat domain-containing protein [Gammaproteobacteria bacterium]
MLLGIFVFSALSPLSVASASTNEIEISQSELFQVTDSRSTQSVIERIEGAVAADDGEMLLAILTGIGQSTDTAPVTPAFLRYKALMAFGAIGESEVAKRVLQKLMEPGAATGPKIKLLRDVDGHRGFIYVFDPVAAARFALGAWHAEAWAQRTRSDLAAGRHDFVAEWLDAQRAAGGRLAASGLVRGLRQSSLSDLAGLSAPLARHLESGEPVAELAHVVAVRLQDESLARTIIRGADAGNALALLSEVNAFPVAARLGLLESAVGRFELRSAALYGIGQLNTPAGRQALIARLGSDEMGTSAAAALARYPGTQLLGELAALVRSDAAPLARRRAVLALHLYRDPAGKSMLRELARDSLVESDLRELIADKLQ